MEDGAIIIPHGELFAEQCLTTMQRSNMLQRNVATTLFPPPWFSWMVAGRCDRPFIQRDAMPEYAFTMPAADGRNE